MNKIVPFMICLSLAIFSATAQPFNTEIDANGKSPFLLGKINQDRLSQNPYGDWFLKNYTDYQPKAEVIEKLQPILSEYTLTVFMGTWCGDSKREVPRLYKILDQAGFPIERLTMVAVSRARDAYKQSPGGEEEGLNIHRVPTIIFFKDGKEINRIVESPVQTLEEDIYALIKGTYTPNHQVVTSVNNLLLTYGLKKFPKKAKRKLKKLKAEADNMYQLNTYSSVLFYAGEKEEAIAIASLNTLLFPEEAKTYIRLGHKLLQQKRTKEALTNYKKALEIDPKNEDVQKMIEELHAKE